MYRKFPVLLLAAALSTAFYASPHAQTPDSGKIHIPPPPIAVPPPQSVTPVSSRANIPIVEVTCSSARDSSPHA